MFIIIIPTYAQINRAKLILKLLRLVSVFFFGEFIVVSVKVMNY